MTPLKLTMIALTVRAIWPRPRRLSVLEEVAVGNRMRARASAAGPIA